MTRKTEGGHQATLNIPKCAVSYITLTNHIGLPIAILHVSNTIKDSVKSIRGDWILSLFKEKLLCGNHVTQTEILELTDGNPRRLMAIIYYLARHGWRISRYGRNGMRVYFLTTVEIERIKGVHNLVRSGQ